MNTPATNSADTHDAAPGPPPAGPPDDVMIHCMSCDYNVTYTPEDRCPECGQPFDRAALVEWTTGRDQPLPFGRAQPHKFRSIFLASLFTPSKVGRQLPPYPNLGQAFRYSLGMKAIVLGMAIVMTFLMAPPSLEYVVWSTINWGLMFFVGDLLCELLLAVVFRVLVRPQWGLPEGKPWSFWLAFSFSFAGYSVATVFVMCVGYAMIAIEEWLGPGNLHRSLFLLLKGINLVVALWWWSSLSRALHARGESSWRTTTAVLLVPLVAIVVIIPLQLLVSYLVMLFF